LARVVRALVFRFEAFARPITNMKKFEEGVFSDLRNLKPGTDACLEEAKVSSKAVLQTLPVRKIG
jgi:transcription factor STE12